MEYQFIRLERDGGVASLTMTRADKLNALNPRMADEMRHALANLDNARVVLLQGEGRAFCSGTDLGDMGAADGAMGEGARSVLTDHYNPLITDLAELKLPIVAAVSGLAAGIGVSLALSADFVVAGQSAYLLEAFVNIGLVPDGGASWLLPRLIGKARATEMAMLGERLSAQKACEWGLIYKAVGDELVGSEAMALAQRLAAGPTVALGLMRANMFAALDGSLAETMANEASAQSEVADSVDAREGTAAFLQKRRPTFTGS